jgi:hypothetical protein
MRGELEGEKGQERGGRRKERERGDKGREKRWRDREREESTIWYQSE